jgi:phosphoribosylformylglycinamidine cyclo-ligase
VDKGLFPQAFCKVVPDTLGGDPEYCTCMHADGAGTKSSLAYMYWRETGRGLHSSISRLNLSRV